MNNGILKNMNEKWNKIIFTIVEPPDIIKIEKIHSGGSDRHYHRIHAKNNTFILQKTGNKKDIREYVAMARCFEQNGVPAPEILVYDKTERIALMEDAGDIDIQSITLEMLKNDDKDGILELYKDIIGKLIRIQEIPISSLPDFVRSRKFDFEHYRWETDYFLENCVSLFFGISDMPIEKIRKELDQLAKSLFNEPSYPVHRDFQSQNVYIRNGNIFILDFQSARTGSIFYDLASLLKDPYVEIPEEIHDILFNHYIEKRKKAGVYRELDPTRATDIYNRVSLQRLMQALGAYGNLGINKGKSQFLQYIPPAVRLLHSTIRETDSFPFLKNLVEELDILVRKR
ncbi:MAG: phosphotransferase [Candidatus Eremiobacteraeota bacterium]|nr:phosphotransferase [Candidatus Eremiobacteraeota bacterium]